MEFKEFFSSKKEVGMCTCAKTVQFSRRSRVTWQARYVLTFDLLYVMFQIQISLHIEITIIIITILFPSPLIYIYINHPSLSRIHLIQQQMEVREGRF